MYSHTVLLLLVVLLLCGFTAQTGSYYSSPGNIVPGSTDIVQGSENTSVAQSSLLAAIDPVAHASVTFNTIGSVLSSTLQILGIFVRNPVAQLGLAYSGLGRMKLGGTAFVKVVQFNFVFSTVQSSFSAVSQMFGVITDFLTSQLGTLYSRPGRFRLAGPTLIVVGNLRISTLSKIFLPRLIQGLTLVSVTFNTVRSRFTLTVLVTATIRVITAFRTALQTLRLTTAARFSVLDTFNTVRALLTVSPKIKLPGVVLSFITVGSTLSNTFKAFTRVAVTFKTIQDIFSILFGQTLRISLAFSTTKQILSETFTILPIVSVSYRVLGSLLSLSSSVKVPKVFTFTTKGINILRASGVAGVPSSLSFTAKNPILSIMTTISGSTIRAEAVTFGVISQVFRVVSIVTIRDSISFAIIRQVLALSPLVSLKKALSFVLLRLPFSLSQHITVNVSFTFLVKQVSSFVSRVILKLSASVVLLGSVLSVSRAFRLAQSVSVNVLSSRFLFSDMITYRTALAFLISRQSFLIVLANRIVTAMVSISTLGQSFRIANKGLLSRPLTISVNQAKLLLTTLTTVPETFSFIATRSSLVETMKALTKYSISWTTVGSRFNPLSLVKLSLSETFSVLHSTWSVNVGKVIAFVLSFVTVASRFTLTMQAALSLPVAIKTLGSTLSLAFHIKGLFAVTVKVLGQSMLIGFGRTVFIALTFSVQHVSILVTSAMRAKIATSFVVLQDQFTILFRLAQIIVSLVFNVIQSIISVLAPTIFPNTIQVNAPLTPKIAFTVVGVQ